MSAKRSFSAPGQRKDSDGSETGSVNHMLHQISPAARRILVRPISAPYDAMFAFAIDSLPRPEVCSKLLERYFSHVAWHWQGERLLRSL